MAEIVNLRRERKRKAAADRDAKAAANRAKFGRTGAEREKAAALEALEKARHEAHKRRD